jgi:hypothetical protein
MMQFTVSPDQQLHAAARIVLHCHFQVRAMLAVKGVGNKI